MDLPTDLRPPVRPFAVTPRAPALGERVQVLWYAVLRDEAGFHVENHLGEELAADENWDALVLRLGWQATSALPGVAAIDWDSLIDHDAPRPNCPCCKDRRPMPVRPFFSSRPPRPANGETLVVGPYRVLRKDCRCCKPSQVRYMVYKGDELVAMSMNWRWLCHTEGFWPLDGVEHGRKIPKEVVCRDDQTDDTDEADTRIERVNAAASESKRPAWPGPARSPKTEAPRPEPVVPIDSTNADKLPRWLGATRPAVTTISPGVTDSQPGEVNQGAASLQDSPAVPGGVALPVAEIGAPSKKSGKGKPKDEQTLSLFGDD